MCNWFLTVAFRKNIFLVFVLASLLSLVPFTTYAEKDREPENGHYSYEKSKKNTSRNKQNKARSDREDHRSVNREAHNGKSSGKHKSKNKGNGKGKGHNGKGKGNGHHGKGKGKGHHEHGNGNGYGHGHQNDQPPVITAEVLPLANAFGWSSSAVTVVFNCSDDNNQIEFCSEPVSVELEGADQIIEGTAIDCAGQESLVSVVVSLDTTKPQVDFDFDHSPNANNWFKDSVNVLTKCQDGLSGIESCTADQLVESEGLQQSVFGSGVDRAGNTTTTSINVNVDKTSPTIQSFFSVPSNAEGWHNTAIGIDYQCNDSLSGVEFCSANQLVGSEGAQQSFAASVKDNAGNQSQIVSVVNVDLTKPTITTSISSVPDAQGIYHQPITVSFICSDGLSGIQSCPEVITVDQDGLGQEISGTVFDKAGNSNTASTIVNLRFNQSPVITSTSISTIDENELYVYTVTAEDADNDSLDFSLVQSPAGMTIDSATGLIEWAIGFESAGSHSIVVFVNDGNGGSAQQEFILNVVNVNRVPVASPQNLTVNEDENVSFSLSGLDEDGQTLSYIIVDQPSNGTITRQLADTVYTPNQNFSGTDTFTFKVSDAVEESAIAVVTIDVTAINDAPVFNYSPIVIATENQNYSDAVIATDIDGDTLAYQLTNSPVGMSIDSQTGVINWLLGFDTSNGQPYEVSVEVTDGKTTATLDYEITVVNVNRAPIANDESITTNEDSAVAITLMATDADHDVLTYTISTQPTHGTLTGTAPQLLYTPATDFNGNDTFSFEVSDGINAVEGQIDITVIVVNDMPVISSMPIVNGTENIVYEYVVTATDADGGVLSFTLESAPPGMIINDSGTITWLPGFDAAGDHIVSVSVTDDLASQALQTYTLTVANTNRAPVINAIADIALEANQTQTITINATDGDADTLTFSVSNLPSFATLNGNQIQLTPSNGDEGVYNSIDVTVTDGFESVSTSFSINVSNSNRAPVISSAPVDFVVQGDLWNYTITATDPEQDVLSYALTQAPVGLVFDANTQQATWSSENVEVGFYDVEFTVTDAGGAFSQQNFQLEILGVDRRSSHVGTEFIIPFSVNHIFSKTPTEGSYNINLVSAAADTQVVITVPVLGLSETLNLVQGELVSYSLDKQAYYDLGGFAFNQVLENFAINITSQTPISVYVMNQKQSTTDGFVAFPVASAGKEFIVASYNMLTRLGISKTVDGGQPGSIATIVANQDDTQVIINASMDVFVGDQGQIEYGTPIELTLNKGDVYNLETKGSFKADLTGTFITSDKPVSVYGQVDCTYIPVPIAACDHIVEQLPPIDTLATEHFIVPFWGRAGDERSSFDSGVYGDRIRVVAPYEDTTIYVDGVLKAQINRGEYFEYLTFNPEQITSSHPVLIAQYSNSDTFDNRTNRDLPRDYADPFMVIVPPVPQYLNEYIFTTPARDLEYNFVNVIVPESSLSTLTLDGATIDETLFTPIANSSHLAAQINIGTGSHFIKADEPFAIYVYGYDYFESYGYLGGVALTSSSLVSDVSVENVNVAPLQGDNTCVDALLLDTFDRPVQGVRAKFSVTGNNPQHSYQFSNNEGLVTFCYQGVFTGDDLVIVTVAELSDSITLNWGASAVNFPPIITSQPQLALVAGESYRYQVQAFDPEGEQLSYELVETAQNVTIDPVTGLLDWPRALLGSSRKKKFVVRVTDDSGFWTEQAFELRPFTGDFNSLPEFQPATHAVEATVGVRYIYNLDAAQSNLLYPKFQMDVTDADEDGVYIDILEGPVEAKIQRTISAFVDIENDPRHCVACRQLLLWTPETVGPQTIELGLRDARGAVAESKIINVNVAPNTPPEVVNFNPPQVASVGYEYSYVLEIENDVQPMARDNLDNLRVVFENAPSNMRSELIRANDTQFLRVFWTPNSRDVGVTNVKFHIDDQRNSSDSVEFTLQIIDNNSPPVITLQSPPHAEVSLPYELQILATDPDGDALTYGLLVAPEGMVVDANTGLIRWTPTEEFAVRSITVRYVVTDTGGLTAEKLTAVYSQPFINRAPEFVPTYRPLSAKVGVEFNHQELATDREGDLPITYRISSSATGVEIDSSTGIINWTPTQEGRFWLKVAAIDSLGNGASANSAFWYVDVLPATALLDASLQFSPSNIIDLGESVTLTVVPENEATSPQVSLEVDGVPVLVDRLLQAQITPTRVGKIPVTATVSSGSETIVRTAYVFVRDPADTTPPVVDFVSPVNLDEITAPTQIFVTAQDDNLVEVLLLFKRADEPLGSHVQIEDFEELYRGPNTFLNEMIAELDPTMLLNGTYHFLLQATDSNGNINAAAISVNLVGDLKVGNFSVTLEDLNIPLEGLPLSVSRTYDSRQKSENLDFGYGWSIDYQNVRLEESIEPTEGWSQVASRGSFKTTSGIFTSTAHCIYPTYGKSVTVTLPNGDTEKFIVALKPNSGTSPSLGDPHCYLPSNRFYDVYFIPAAGTNSTLSASGTSSLYLSDLENGYLSDIGAGLASQITQYTLTTKTGYIYSINQDLGLEKIEDPNGNTLTYTDTGIVHSSGKSINFIRDSLNRISELQYSSGETVVNYIYDASGDLVSVTDAVGSTTSFEYNNDHGLTDILDPLNRRLVRNIYDDTGRLIAQEDASGNRTNFDHNLDGRESVVTDRNGNITVFRYNDRGDVTSQIDALGNVTLFSYDENSNQLSKTDALGNTETATFTDKNDQLTHSDALGNTVQYAYNARGQETVITDSKGNAFSNTYDGFGNLLSITDPLGNTASNVVLGGRVTSTTDTLGNVTSYTYNPFAHKESETDAEGNVILYTYDDNGNVLTESRSRTLAGGSVVNEATTYEYDAKDRITATIDALGHRFETEYDLAGQVIAEVDALGRRSEMDYDVYGRLIEMRYPDGTKQNSTYDPESNLLSETDRKGATTTYEYDALNRQVAIIAANGARSETVYDEIGRVVANIDALNNRTEFEYDAIGRRTLTRDALGNEHRFEYDSEGNLTAEIDALSHRTEYSYNILDQRIQTLYHDGSALQESFDALGRRVSQTDQAGITTSYAYDKLGRLTKVIDVQLNETSYSYDEVGNKLTQTDAEGRTTNWEYDALGRVSKRILPLGQEETFTYDDSGTMTSHSDFNGDVSLHLYDVLNRLVQSDFTDGSRESFQYDNNGNRTQAQQTDLSGFIRTTQFSFDILNRLQSETKPNAGRLGGTQLAYRYDLAGNKTQLTVTHADTTQTIADYNYDALNRLQSVSDSNGVTSYGYDAVGNRRSVSYGNGTSQLYIYDTLNRLTRMETFNASGTLVQSFDYTLHATGRRTQIDELSGRSTSYSYDNLYRLSSEDVLDSTNGAYAASYLYDKVGNRLFETVDGVQTAYSYDLNDRLLQTGGSVFTYDNQGNTLTETLDGVVTTYAYNSQHELISQSQSGQLTEFAYNADGIRNGKGDSSGTSTGFIIDNNLDYAQVIREDDGITIVSYTYGDDLVSQNREGALSYYLYDGLGSTRALSDAAGNITDEYNYEAFGELLNQVGSTENDYLFAGEQFDEDLDQYYLRARYYNQNTGRFTQQDTYLGNNFDPVTLHKYLYGNADPVGNIDPSGNFSLGQVMAAVRIVGIQATNAVARVRGLFGAAGGTGSSALGAVIVLNASKGLLKSIAKRCKSKGGKGNACKYALGWAMAHAKMHALARVTPWKVVKARNYVVITGAFDIKRGKGTAAFNGNVRANTKLERHVNKFGSYIGEKDACGTKFTTGRCAEFRAARNLLRSGSKLKNIRFINPRYIRRRGEGSYVGPVRPKGACDICEASGFGPTAP